MVLGNAKFILLTSVAVSLMLMMLSLPAIAAESVSVGSLDLSKVRQEWGEPQADKSVDGNPLTIGGKTYEKGLGTHAASAIWIDLKGDAERFTAYVGVDDEDNANGGTVEFRIVGDKRELWKSKVISSGMPAEKVEVDLKGVKTLQLLVSDGGDGIDHDHADWADAKIEYSGEPPVTIAVPPESTATTTP